MPEPFEKTPKKKKKKVEEPEVEAVVEAPKVGKRPGREREPSQLNR